MTNASPVRIRGDIGTVAAAIAGAAPGLLLPFAIAIVYPPTTSDLMLLAISVAVTTTALSGAAIEVNSVANVGGVLARGRHASRASLRKFRLRSLLYGLGIAVVIVPALAAIYWWRLDDPRAFLTTVAVLGLAPVVGAYSSAVAGEAIALGRAHWAVGVQAARALVPLIALAFGGPVPLWTLALAYVAGEAVRGLVLVVVCEAAVRSDALLRVDSAMSVSRVAWQSGALAIAQSQPVVDRAIIAGAEAGALTSYDLADRTMQSGAQLVLQGILQRRVGRWARIRAMSRDDAAHMFRRDAMSGLIWSVLVAGGVAAVCGVALLLGIVPEAWRTGLLWGLILTPSIPTLLVTTAGSRLLVIAGRQRLLVGFAAVAAVSTFALDLAFFALWGAVGVILAAVVVRAGLAVLHLLVLRRVIPPIIGSEPTGGKEAEQAE